MSKKAAPALFATILLRAVLLPLKAVIALAVLVDEMLRPIYRPVVRKVAGLAFFHILERQVAALPRWAILIVFAVPFLVAEPLKLVAVILFAKGRAVLGVATFLIAQLLTFILVERIFHAGRAKLTTYWWFAWAVQRAGHIRDMIYSIGKRLIRRIRALVRLHA